MRGTWADVQADARPRRRCIHSILHRRARLLPGPAYRRGSTSRTRPSERAACRRSGKSRLSTLCLSKVWRVRSQLGFVRVDIAGRLQDMLDTDLLSVSPLPVAIA